MFALSLNGLSPCQGFLQQLVPAYKRLRHQYHIFTFSQPNQTLYFKPSISKLSSCLNISCHVYTQRAHTCSLLPLASSIPVQEKGLGNCWSRTRLHIDSSNDGGSFPNTASEEHRLVADGQKRSLHGAAFHSACWPQHEAAQHSFQAANTKLHRAGIPTPPPQIPASIFSYRQHQHIAGEPCGSWEHAGRFPSQGEVVLHRTACDLASPLNCAGGTKRAFQNVWTG